MKKSCFFLIIAAMLFSSNNMINSMFKRVAPSAVKKALAFQVASSVHIKSSDKKGESKSSGNTWYKGKWQRLSAPFTAASVVAAGVCGFTHNCIANAAEINDVDEEFLNAVRMNDKATIHRLLPKVTKIDEALSIAVRRDNVDLVTLLAPMAKNVDQELITAAGLGSVKIVAMLLPMEKNVDGLLNLSITNAHNYPYISFYQDIFVRVFLKANEIINKKIAAGEDVSESSLELITKAVRFLSNRGTFRSLLSNDQTRDLAFYFVTFANQDWLCELLKPKEQTDDTKTATEILLEKNMTFDMQTLQTACDYSGIDNGCYSVGDLGDLSALLRQVITVEKEDKKQGYTTFVHGRHWSWNFVNDVWNIIRAVRDDKDIIPSDISMRQRDADCNVEKLLKYREKLVPQGVTEDNLVSSTNWYDQEKAEVTFMNYTGLSHLDCAGESSIMYSLNGIAVTGAIHPYEIAKKILYKNGLEKHIKELEKLYQLHELSNKRGELLTISIKNNHVDGMVYPAMPFGYIFPNDFCFNLINDLGQILKKAIDNQFPVEAYPILDHNGSNLYRFNGNGTTSLKIKNCNQKMVQDPKYFQRFSSPDNSLIPNISPIFCAVSLSNPKEGHDVCKIRSLHIADDNKYKKYLAARQELFEKLKKEKVV